jgi:adenine-specific DNA-methyltransferase
VYSDKFEFSDEKLKSILSYTDEEIIRLKSIQGKSSHSAWLTFMYPRLKIAQKLLKDDGVIFVSIDDNEQANLKLLLDDVFGEGNFVIDFIRKTKSMTGDESSGVNIQHENVICFGKNKSNVFLMGEEKKFDNYNNPDNDINGEWTSGDPSAKSGGVSTYFPIKNLFTGKQDFPPKGRFWAFSMETCDEYIAKGKIKFKEKYKDNERGFIFKRYKNELSTNFNPINSLDLSGNDYMNAVGTKELYDLLNGNYFDNPKPLSLIKKLISVYPDKDSLILDFFAGSATTAHAVMQLNAEDGGNRKFIMVQLDEETNPDSEARKAGYNTIDEIARERIIKAGKKILADYKSDLVKQSNGWDKDIGFKHYRLVTPDVKTIEKIVEFKPDEANLIVDDMIKPFEYKKTKTSGLDTILATWLIDDRFRFDTHVEEIVFGNYKAHYVREAAKLYLINQDWDTAALKTLLNQIGTNKLPVTTIIVYPYSFEFEAMRELKTNIKTNLYPSPNLIERF